MKFNEKKALSMLVSTLLIASLLLTAFNLFTGAQPSEDLLYLHGPSLAPIHMNSNITLTPIHMHSLIPWQEYLWEPIGTGWHELYPEFCPIWNLTSWLDNDQNGLLSPNDQIDMTDMDRNITWYHVDRITITLELSNPENTTDRMFIELKIPANWTPRYSPVQTYWHEVYPKYCNVYACINWIDSPPPPGGNGIVDYCDFIDLQDVNTGGIRRWHVEFVANDIILRWKMMNPICTWWHEIYPNYCTWRHLTSWESYPDGYCDRLSPGDQIDMIEEGTDIKTWYFVDRVTVTLNVTYGDFEEYWMKIELKTWHFEEMYNAFKHPLDTRWHEVYPNYCNVYNLTWWDPEDPYKETDNCNGVLDVCDHIWLLNTTADQPYEFLAHIVDMTYDLILNEKVTDPVCTDWLQLQPSHEEPYIWHHVDWWLDNQDGLLSPCDYINLTEIPGPTKTYHVEKVNVTAKLESMQQPGSFIYIEALLPFEEMYWAKIQPWAYNWQEVWPIFGTIYEVYDWVDNCNGVLDYCDYITLMDPTGFPSYWHVEEVALDMVVKEVIPPLPPPQMYWKRGYPDYAPSGMPDFDQRQWLTYNWTNINGWSHCGPVAVANSLWWLDSEYELNMIGPPEVSDSFPLVSSYATMPPTWDDHDPTNVPHLVEHLAYLMDTNGLRTLQAKLDTNVFDMQTGITHYLSWTGVNPKGDCNGDGIVTIEDAWIVGNATGKTPGMAGWDMRADIQPVTTGWPNRVNADNDVDILDMALVTANMGKTGLFYEHTVRRPDFYYIEEEVEKCQDVVLLLGFWYEYAPGQFYREFGHYVTVAGINSTTQQIAISNPIRDDFEAGLAPGRSPVPHVHIAPEPPYITHNNASLVSHDIFIANFYPCPGGDWELLGYPGFLYPWHVQIEYAVITSPLGTHDVAVTDVRPLRAGKTQVGQNLPFKVNATVQNQGNFPETFNVTAYADAIVIGEQQVALNPGDTTTLVFIWNTTGVPKGNYTLSATADIVPLETDILDNTFIDGLVRVTMMGDCVPDLVVDIFDLVYVSTKFGSEEGIPPPPGTQPYDPNADLNCDGIIDIFDIVTVAINYGNVDP